jgi:hypothetical protein
MLLPCCAASRPAVGTRVERRIEISLCLYRRPGLVPRRRRKSPVSFPMDSTTSRAKGAGEAGLGSPSHASSRQRVPWRSRLPPMWRRRKSFELYATPVVDKEPQTKSGARIDGGQMKGADPTKWSSRRVHFTTRLKTTALGLGDASSSQWHLHFISVASSPLSFRGNATENFPSDWSECDPFNLVTGPVS